MVTPAGIVMLKVPVASAPAEKTAVWPAAHVCVAPRPVETLFQLRLVRLHVPDGTVPPAPVVAALRSQYKDWAKTVLVGTAAATAEAKAANGRTDRREKRRCIALSPAPFGGRCLELR